MTGIFLTDGDGIIIRKSSLADTRADVLVHQLPRQLRHVHFNRRRNGAVLMGALGGRSSDPEGFTSIGDIIG